MPLRSYSGNAKRTAITGDITSSSTSFTVSDATGYPSPGAGQGPFVVTLNLGLTGEEKVLVASRSGNTFTLAERGFDGTAAAAHGAGATVDHTLSAADIREINAHAFGTEADPHPSAGYVTQAEADALYAALAHQHTQAQSHNSADTDAGPTSLHHTLGAGANQAAPGNHAHTAAPAFNPLTLGLFGPGDGNTTTSMEASGDALFFRFRPLASITVTQIRLYISTTGGNLSVGVFSSSGGLPAARLTTSGDIATPPVGLASITVPGVALTAGTDYWIALSATGAAAFTARTTAPTVNGGVGLLREVVARQAAAHPLPASTTGLTFTNLSQAPIVYIPA